MALLFVKTLHYLCFAALLYSSAMKNWLLRPMSISKAHLLRVRRFDKLSGAAAGIILLTGLAMLLWLSKPTGYYAAQPKFWLKISIFIVASGLIVLTKIAFKRALTKDAGAWAVPRGVKAILIFDFWELLAMAVWGYLIAHQ